MANETPNAGGSLLAPRRLPGGKRRTPLAAGVQDLEASLAQYGPMSSRVRDLANFRASYPSPGYGFEVPGYGLFQYPPNIGGFAPGVGRMQDRTAAEQIYQFGQYQPITSAAGALAAQTLFADPTQREVFSEIERRSPLRTAAWAEPLRQQLDPEVRQAISAMIGLTPTRLGITSMYGDLARGVQELVGAPELGAARGFIGSRLQEGMPEDVADFLREDIRTAQAARGLRFGEASAAEEARRLTMFREAQRQELLGPAMTLGFQTLGMTGFPEMAQIGPISFAPVGTAASQHSQRQFARDMARVQGGFSGLSSLLGAATLGLGAGGLI